MGLLDKFQNLYKVEFKEDFGFVENNKFVNQYKGLMITNIVTLILIYFFTILIFIVPDNIQNKKNNIFMYFFLLVLIAINMGVTLVVGLHTSKKLNIFLRENGKNKERVRFENLLISSSSIMGILCVIIGGMEAFGKLDQIFTMDAEEVRSAVTSGYGMSAQAYYGPQQQVQATRYSAKTNKQLDKAVRNKAKAETAQAKKERAMINAPTRAKYEQSGGNLEMLYLANEHNKALISLGMVLSGIMLQFISTGIMIGNYMAMRAALNGKNVEEPAQITETATE